ncbi:hypothetical protein Tco_0616645, partial [Tanacetum coccineum]
MSQPANDDYSQHLSDGEASYHEDASENGSATNKPKQHQQQQLTPTTTTISNIKLPILKKEEYDIWAMEMEHYLEYIDNDVWKERKARTILLMAIPKEHLRRFHGMDDAKEIWEAIRTRFGGNANSKKMQKAVLKQQFKRDSFYQDQGAGKKEQKQNCLLTMDDGVVNWGEHTVEEEESNHALMAISSNNEVIKKHKYLPIVAKAVKKLEAQLVTFQKQQLSLNEKLTFQANEIYEKDEKLKKYRRIGMKAVKEKEQLQKTLDSWKDSSKNLWRLINSGMSSSSKLGLGTDINSVRSRVNNVTTNVNTVRSRQPVPTRTSISFSPKRPQVNQLNQRRHFSKSYSSERRPFAKITAQMSHSHAVKGNWGSAVKTSAVVLRIGKLQGIGEFLGVGFISTRQMVINSPCLTDTKNWLVQEQTALGKDFSNPLMADNLPKIVCSKSGGWDQFGSNIATALICLSTGRVYNFSKLIFDGMVANLKSKTKFLMYPRFLQLILDIQTENKHPYLAVTLTKKIFGNMKRGFRGAPRPLLPAMLLVATTNPSAGQEHPDVAQSQPSSSTIPVPSTSLPPVQSPPPITAPIPASTPTPIPETDPEPMEHTFEEPSPAHQHFSPPQEHAQGQMTVDDLLQLVPQLMTRVDSLEKDLKQTKLTMGSAIVKLVKKVKKLEGILKRRNVVLSDSEEEEYEAHGRKSHDDPLVSLVQGLVTPSKTTINASGEEQVEDISPTTLEAAKSLSRVASQKLKSIDKRRRYKRRKETKGKKVVISLDFQEEVSTGYAKGVNTSSIKVSTVSGKVSTVSRQVSTDSIKKSIPSPDKGQREEKAPMIIEEAPKKTKEQILQEKASLAEAIRLDNLEKEEEAKQVHSDSLLAQRLTEEEELNKQQKQRRDQ